METFINEFKIYCENVEDTKGLELVKSELAYFALNLETFIDDNMEKTFIRKDEIEEAYRLVRELKEATDEAKIIEETELRDIWKLIKNDGLADIQTKLESACSRCCEYLCDKYLPSYGIFYEPNDGLTEEQLEKWYVDLYQLFDKYGI